MGLVLVTNATRKIYSHPLHGTREVDGALLGEYETQAEEGGSLGYPISGQRSVGGELLNTFERGRIVLPTGAGFANTEIFS